MSELIKIE